MYGVVNSLLNPKHHSYRQLKQQRRLNSNLYRLPLSRSQKKLRRIPERRIAGPMILTSQPLISIMSSKWRRRNQSQRMAMTGAALMENNQQPHPLNSLKSPRQCKKRFLKKQNQKLSQSQKSRRLVRVKISVILGTLETYQRPRVKTTRAGQTISTSLPHLSRLLHKEQAL